MTNTALIHFPKTTKVNKKHPSQPYTTTTMANTALQLFPTIKPAYQIYTSTGYASFSMEVMRPLSVTELSSLKSNPAYNVNGNYIIYVVPRDEESRFFSMYDNGQIADIFKDYARYFGESFTDKPSGRMGDRIKSFMNSLYKQFAGGKAPTRSSGNEASAYKIADDMTTNRKLFLDDSNDYKSMADCVFVSYCDISKSKGPNGETLETEWIEQSLISTFRKFGKLVNK